MKIDSRQIKTLSKIGANQAFFGVGLTDVAKNRDDVYAVTADLCRYSGLTRFAKMYPERFVNVGIAEQSMLNVSAGLALNGNTVYCTSYASFATPRVYEQIRHNLSVLGLDIKVVGHSSGYTMESLGISHWATEDIAIMRCLPNICVISPADNLEAVKICRAVSEIKGSAYIRLYGVENSPIVYEADYEYVIGKAIKLRDGDDAVVLSHGSMVHESLRASDILSERGISVDLYNFHTIKPLDYELLEEIADKHKVIFTVEEHNVIGGLGTAVSEWIASRGYGIKLIRLGMQDQYYKLGDVRFIWQQCGICDYQIADTIINELENR